MNVCVLLPMYLPLWVQSTVTPPSGQTLSRTNSRSTVKNVWLHPNMTFYSGVTSRLAVHACSAQQNMYVYPHGMSSILWQRQSNCSWWGSLLLLMFLFTAIFYATVTSQPVASPRLFKLPSSYLMSVDLILLSRNIGCVSHGLAPCSSLWSFTFTSASSAHDLSI